MEVLEAALEFGRNLRDWSWTCIGEHEAINRPSFRPEVGREGAVVDCSGDSAIFHGVSGQVDAIDERAPSDGGSPRFLGFVGGAHLDHFVRAVDNADGPRGGAEARTRAGAGICGLIDIGGDRVSVGVVLDQFRVAVIDAARIDRFGGRVLDGKTNAEEKSEEDGHKHDAKKRLALFGDELQKA